MAHQLGAFSETNVCVASFCSDGDLLSQWRAYGADAKGIALGFSGQYLSKLSNRGFLHTWKCVYERSDHALIISELVEMALRSFNMCPNGIDASARDKFTKDITGYFNTTFLRVAPILKDSHFHEEQEWRIIAVARKITDDGFDVVHTGSRLLPVYRLEFPKNDDGDISVLKTVRVGPTGSPELLSNALFDLLFKQGYSEYGVQHSLVPYRST